MKELDRFFSGDLSFFVMEGHEEEGFSSLYRWEEQVDGSYIRLSKLPKLTEKTMIDASVKAYEMGEEHPLYPEIKDVSRHFLRNHPLMNETIQRNFTIKLLYWQELFQKEGISKILFLSNETINLHTFLGLYFLKLCGGSVFLWLPHQELEFSKNISRIPTRGRGSSFSPLAINEFTRKSQKKPKEKPKEQPLQQGASLPNSTPVEGVKTEEKQELSLEELALLASSVVKIHVLDPLGQIFRYGSGIMVSERGYILTNCHVVLGGHGFAVEIEEESQLCSDGFLVKYNQMWDLALIEIRRVCKPIPISKEIPRRGQSVVAIGSPLGMMNTISDGIISGFRQVEDRNMIQFTAPTSRGSSGGAVLNRFGELVGVSTAGIEEGQNLNLAVDSTTILGFLKGLL